MKTVPVSLAFMNGTILYNTSVTLTSSGDMKTTKPCSEGRWYYEITHIGGDICMNFGFSYDYQWYESFVIGANPSVSNYFYVYNYSSILMHISSINDSIVKETPISSIGLYSPGFTVGVAYDTFSNIFSIYYNNSFIHINIKNKDSRKGKIGPIFIEGTSGGSLLYHDNIRVNFGQEKFTYDIPLGYQPWNTIWRGCSCIHKTHNHYFVLICYYIVTLKH